MKVLGVLTLVVLSATAGLPYPAYSAPPQSSTAQARRTPVLYVLILDTWDDTGRHSILKVDDFKNWNACKSAGLSAVARFGTNGIHVDFICVPREV